MTANIAWPDALATALERAGRAVVVTVADARGSTPRESGAAMVVSGDGLAGTIGGGHLEYEALRLAREALAGGTPGDAAWLVRFPLAARLGQCCGGVATLAFQVVTQEDAGWLATARACLRTQAPFALVAAIGGERPAHRLLVTRDDARGTLGDPARDGAAIAAARERLAAMPGDPAGASAMIDRHATPLFVHVVRPHGFDVLVFGNGHVGRALVHVLGALPARVRWIDERERDFPAQVPANVEIVATDTPESELRTAPPGSHVVLVTHSHALDFDLAAAALARDDWRYLGMIGSAAKRVQLERRLAQRGLPPEAAARVTCPIGSAGDAPQLRSKEPGVIAIGVAAELLALRERTAAGHAGVRAAADAGGPGRHR
jgi:xanthine dehydrogenase accessory factor